MKLLIALACVCLVALPIWSATAQEEDEPYFFPEDTPDNREEDVPFDSDPEPNPEPYPEEEPFGEPQPDPEPEPEPVAAPPPFDPHKPRNVTLKIIKRDQLDGYCLTFDYVSVRFSIFFSALISIFLLTESTN